MDYCDMNEIEDEDFLGRNVAFMAWHGNKHQ